VNPAFSVEQALAEARATGVERLDAQHLLAFQLDRPRSWLLAHGDVVLSAPQAASFRAGLARLADAEPLAYLLGEQEFHGLRLHVNARVLVPRADTAVVVDWALEILRADDPARTPDHDVLDLGTGSGAIALAIKQGFASARVTAVDASPGALAVAQANGVRLALDVEWRPSDWWSALGARRFDLIVSNPPYIADGDAHLAGLRHEPMLALCSGADGLDAIRQIAAGAARHLHAGGWLVLEHGFDQADAVRALLAGHGLSEAQTRRDLAGRPRCTAARLAPAGVGKAPHFP
jgi:release factor glutamine methyltransferase